MNFEEHLQNSLTSGLPFILISLQISSCIIFCYIRCNFSWLFFTQIRSQIYSCMLQQLRNKRIFELRLKLTYVNKSVKQLVGNCLCLCLYMSVGWKLHLLMVKLDREANVYMSDIFTTTKVVSSPWVPNELDFKPTWIISVSLLKIIVCVATISFKTISICRVWKVSLSFKI